MSANVEMKPMFNLTMQHLKDMLEIPRLLDLIDTESSHGSCSIYDRTKIVSCDLAL